MTADWGMKCACCGLDTVGRDYDKGGFSCGVCGIERGSDAWNKIVEFRTRVAELEAQLNEASLLAGHALSVLENGNLPYGRRIASALYVLREPALAEEKGYWMTTQRSGTE